MCLCVCVCICTFFFLFTKKYYKKCLYKPVYTKSKFTFLFFIFINRLRKKYNEELQSHVKDAKEKEGNPGIFSQILNNSKSKY